MIHDPCKFPSLNVYHYKWIGNSDSNSGISICGVLIIMQIKMWIYANGMAEKTTRRNRSLRQIANSLLLHLGPIHCLFHCLVRFFGKLNKLLKMRLCEYDWSVSVKTVWIKRAIIILINLIRIIMATSV